MRVAVTGAAGYVGINLVERLITDGHDVVAIDRAPLPPDLAAEWHETDILDRAAVREAIAEAEVVFHLAAKVTLSDRDDGAWTLNTAGVAAVARACLDADVRRMVHCSSVHAYDERSGGDLLTESSPHAVHPELPLYDRSKYAGEQELRKVIADGLDAVICNPTGIYGPRDSPGRISRLNAMVLDAALGRAAASIEGAFDLVDVRDVADGLIRAASRGRTGENYLLPGELVSMHQLLAAAASVAGRPGPLTAVPLPVVRAIMPIAALIGDAMGSDVMNLSAVAALEAAPRVDGSKAREELGFQPRVFTDTVRDLVALYVHSGTLARRGRGLQRT